MNEERTGKIVADDAIADQIAQFSKRSLFQRALDWFYGYDYFISYRWSDGRVYALALAQQLEAQGFDCFLDSADYIKGENWKIAGARSLRKTSRLVLVGSPHAARPVPPRAVDNDPVLRELRIFTTSGKRVLPINFGGLLTSPDYATVPLIQFLDHDGLWILEDSLRLAIGPSEETVNSLRLSFDLERQVDKRSRVLRILISIFAALAVTASAAAIVAIVMYFLAEDRRLLAELKARIANVQRLSALADATRYLHPQRSLLLSTEAMRISLDRNEPPLSAATQSMLNNLTQAGGRALYRHNATIRKMLVSPDDHWIVTGAEDGSLCFYDRRLDSPRPRFIQGHEGVVSWLTLSPDQRVLATASYDGTVRLWQLDNLNAPPINVDRNSQGGSIALFTPHSDRLITAGNGNKAYVWDLKDLNKEPRVLTGHTNWIAAAAITPDGRLVTVSRDSTARVWDLDSATKEPRILNIFGAGGEVPLQFCAISKDGRRLAVAGEDRAVWFGDLVDEVASVVKFEEHAEDVSTLMFDREGFRLASGSRDRTTRLWRVESLDDKPDVLRGHEGEITAIAFHPNETIVATAGGPILRPVFLVDGRSMQQFGTDTTIRLWDLRDVHLIDRPIVLRGHEGAVQQVLFSSDGSSLFSAGDDGITREWPIRFSIVPPTKAAGNQLTSSDDDLQVGPALPIVQRMHKGTVSELAICEKSGLMATRGADRRLALCEFPSLAHPLGRTLANRENDATLLHLLTFTFSTDGKHLLTCDSDGRIQEWNQAELEAPPQRVAQIADIGWEAKFSSNARRLLVQNKNGKLEVYATIDWKAPPIHLDTGDDSRIRRMMISDDGNHVAAELNDQDNRPRGVILWNLSAPKSSSRKISLTKFLDSLCLSSQGRYLATAEQEGETRLWDLGTSEPVPRTLAGHTGNVTELAFSGDEQRLATGGGKDDRTVIVWSTGDPETEPLVLPQIEPLINGLALSHDGQHLVLVDGSGHARLWPLAPDVLVPLARQTAGRGLSPAEHRQYLTTPAVSN